MDATRILNNRRGIAIIYLALILTVLIAFAGLAIDLGYMFVTKSQLRNAADAGALAGAYGIMSTANINDTIQTRARVYAKQYAEKNIAAAINVSIASDGTNTISNANDITVGNWNGTSYTANAIPINAIEVNARRTTNSPAGNVESFFAKVLNINSFDVVSKPSVASIPPRATGFITLGQFACPTPDGTVDNAVRILRSNTDTVTTAFAWTDLTANNTPTPAINQLICGQVPLKDVCSKNITTTNGSNATIVKDLASLMYNPTIDSESKDCNNGAKCASGDTVTGWDLIVPVVNVTDDPAVPGNQPTAYEVIKYAMIHVVAVCAAGNAAGCFGASSGGQGNNDPCKDYKTSTPLADGDPNNPNNLIIINSIKCLDCDDPYFAYGQKAVLVQ